MEVKIVSPGDSIFVEYQNLYICYIEYAWG